MKVPVASIKIRTSHRKGGSKLNSLYPEVYRSMHATVPLLDSDPQYKESSRFGAHKEHANITRLRVPPQKRIIVTHNPITWDCSPSHQPFTHSSRNLFPPPKREHKTSDSNYPLPTIHLQIIVRPDTARYGSKNPRIKNNPLTHQKCPFFVHDVWEKF